MNCVRLSSLGINEYFRTDAGTWRTLTSPTGDSDRLVQVVRTRDGYGVGWCARLTDRLVERDALARLIHEA